MVPLLLIGLFGGLMTGSYAEAESETEPVAQVQNVPSCENLSAQTIPLEALEIVPQNEQSDISSVPGEVLSAGSAVSPVTDNCGGLVITTGDFLCTENGVDIDVSDGQRASEQAETITFNKNCEIKLTKVTIPAYWIGTKRADGDVRLNVQNKGEEFGSPPFSNYVNTYFAVEYDDEGESRIAQDFNVFRGHEAPNLHEALTGSGGPGAYIEMITNVVGDGGTSVNTVESNTEGTGTGACEPAPVKNHGGLQCESPLWTAVVTDMELTYIYSAPNPKSEASTKRQGDESAAEDTPEAKQAARHCTTPAEMVPARLSCLSTPSLVGGVANIFGSAQCAIDSDACYTDVKIIINTAKLIGDNAGCSHPCPDWYSDLTKNILSAPDPDKADSTIPPNTPYYEDRYVGTPCTVSVCGRNVNSVCLWKDWLKDYYDRVVLENNPCDPDDPDKVCTWDEFKEMVYDANPGNVEVNL